ncbi:MAG: glycoside hydrolase family 15 protein [Thermoplasmata archaeon]
MDLRGTRVAPNAPGTPIGWAPSSKDGFGTAYSADSRLWFTLWRGIVTELYHPTIDRPQVRAIFYGVTDGATFFSDELRHLRTETSQPHSNALDYHVVNSDPEGRFSIEKDILAAPHQSALLIHTRLVVHRPELRDRLKLFAFAVPHLDVMSSGTTGAVYQLLGSPVLTATRSDVGLVIGADVPFLRASAGYIDGGNDLSAIDTRLDIGPEWDLAPNGSVGLTAEIAVPRSGEFTLAIAVGSNLESAATTLLQSLGSSFARHRDRFVLQWQRAAHHSRPTSAACGDAGHLARTSRMTLLASEDKLYPGAFIASPSTPWGWARSDDQGGYHLVWTRDLVHTATALLANGIREAPLRSLIYLASRQQQDGGFPQNFWIDGRPYWTGLQLDEVAYPILLAWRLQRERALEHFDPYPMILRAARFLVERGPVTQQDRWEEVSGFSPSTLALEITALLGASEFARARSDHSTAAVLEETADFLERHVEQWTVTTHGTLDPSIPRHYVRVRPALPSDPTPPESGGFGGLYIPNLAPGQPAEFRAQEIISTEFLELVRYGIRDPLDPTVTETVRLVDRQLKVDTPLGPCWKRYNHDGYGQGPGGAPYRGWGIGRPWPLLVGERGHYELAAGHDAAPYAHAMERFATPTGLLTEQIWDEADRPELGLFNARPSGAAMPLAWAHAEYLTLLRSIDDGQVFDRIPSVAERYLTPRARGPALEIWKFNRQVARIPGGRTLRVQAMAPFLLHWSDDDWRTSHDARATATPLGVHHVELAPMDDGQHYRFTFYWPAVDRWEGRDFEVVAGPLPEG